MGVVTAFLGRQAGKECRILKAALPDSLQSRFYNSQALYPKNSQLILSEEEGSFFSF
jgi:hypothetical protein